MAGLGEVRVNTKPLKGIAGISYLRVSCTLALLLGWQPCLWGETIKHHITVGREKRTYYVYTPQDDSPHQQYPLVIVMHGGGGTHRHAEKMTGMNERADSEGFIVSYPDGSGRNHFVLTWNATHCCGYAQRTGAQDIEFIDRMIERITVDYSIDRKKVFVTGMSNGAMLAHQVGIALSHKIAAVGAVVGALFGDEPRPSEPVSVMMINGTEDRHVPIEGGYAKVERVKKNMDRPYQSALDTFDFWASVSNCKNESKTDRVGNVEQIRAQGCPAGVDIVLYQLHGAGHAWPGGQRGSPWGDEPVQDISATDIILDFFMSHPKDARTANWSEGVHEDS